MPQHVSGGDGRSALGEAIQYPAELNGQPGIGKWLDFLRQIDRETPKDKSLHLICDNYATHKHPKVKEWLEKHARFTVHFTPTSASWLHMVERYFRDIAMHNPSPRPFVWTAKANDILQKVIGANRHLRS